MAQQAEIALLDYTKSLKEEPVVSSKETKPKKTQRIKPLSPKMQSDEQIEVVFFFLTLSGLKSFMFFVCNLKNFDCRLLVWLLMTNEAEWGLMALPQSLLW